MKNHVKVFLRALALPVLLATFNLQPSTIRAQGTAFTYQGRLDSGGALANGGYDMAFTLYATNQTGSIVAGPVTNTAVAVSNGLFTTTVNFGSGIFTGTNYWLEIAVSTNGANAFSTLAPRQPLTPVPYAIFAGGVSASGLTGTIPAANVGGSYGNPVNFNNGLNTFDGTFYGLYYGSSFVGGTFVGSGSGLSDVWHTDGNLGTLPALNYLGTADNQPLIIKVNAQEAFRFEPTTNTPNVVGGYSGNSVQPGLYGVAIGGGGAPFLQNTISGNGYYAAIAGGLGNSAGGYTATVGGGNDNNALGDYSVIGGGQFNSMDPSDIASTIAGGHAHRMDGGVTSSTIGGGFNNIMETNVYRATIAGGNANIIHAGSFQSAIGGGAFNVIGTNSSSAVIAGGYQNTIGSNNAASMIAGGFANAVSADSYQSAVAGGFGNGVGPASPYSVIAGGFQNLIGTNTPDAAIGGGAYNTMGTNNTASVIAGGYLNSLGANDYQSVIAGGYNNNIGDRANYSVIAGGFLNNIQTNMPYSFIGGGLNNNVSYGFTNPPVGFMGVAGVVGGWGNRASGILSFVGGGIGNTASGIGSVVLGGNVYQYTASNGVVYYIPGTGAKGMSSTVLGGLANSANGDFSLAAGYFAQADHSGTFVWADSQFPATPVFSSTTSNEFSIRAQNGVHIVADKGIHLNDANEPVIVRDWDVFATNAPAYKAGIGRWGMFMEPFNLVIGIPDTNNLPDANPRYFQVGLYATNGSYTSLMSVDQSGNVTAAGSINGSGIAGNGTGLTNVNAATLNGLASSNFWTTTGNASTTPGVNYIGTSDGQNLLIRGHFVGIGRNNAIGSEFFGVEAPVSSGYGGMYIDTAGSTAKPFYGYSLGGGGVAWHYVDGSDTNKWKLYMAGVGGAGVALTVQQNGFVGIGTTAPANPLTMGSGAYCSVAGVWTSVSDRNAKENFTTIAPSDVLAKVAALPINQWKYKVEPPGIKHLGPVAQDFFHAFGLGDNDRAIGSIDENGVALAAIQGLNQKVESGNTAMANAIQELNRKLDQKDAENALLKQQLASLEARVQQLAQARQEQ